MKTYNEYGYPDVDAIRKLLNPPWHKRLRAHFDPVSAFVWCIGIPAYLAGLLEACFHRRAILDWFQQLGYWQWVVILMILAVLVMLGHYVYQKGRR